MIQLQRINANAKNINWNKKFKAYKLDQLNKKKSPNKDNGVIHQIPLDSSPTFQIQPL